MLLTGGTNVDYSQLWGWWNPQAWAPRTLAQPILPGWTFGNVVTVNERNSRSPETEREIVTSHSYGRQLGRLMDAVAALIEERPKRLPGNPAFDELIDLHQRIAEIKTGTLAARVSRLESDLARLKTESRADYDRIAAKMAGEARA
jgi:hypothetical protein